MLNLTMSSKYDIMEARDLRINLNLDRSNLGST